MTEPAPRRRPGRPKTEGHDERILAAVVALIDRGEPVTVNAVVATSGVSRASLYRRWNGLNELVAAALDQGRATLEIDLTGDIKQALADVMLGDPATARGVGYSEQRFRTRLQLVLADPELQEVYWHAHIRRRRAGIARALEVAVARGQLRADLDIEACIDAINGVFYYQMVVRGVRLDDPGARRRCRLAFETIWRGMSPDDGGADGT